MQLVYFKKNKNKNTSSRGGLQNWNIKLWSFSSLLSSFSIIHANADRTLNECICIRIKAWNLTSPPPKKKNPPRHVTAQQAPEDWQMKGVWQLACLCLLSTPLSLLSPWPLLINANLSVSFSCSHTNPSIIPLSLTLIKPFAYLLSLSLSLSLSSIYPSITLAGLPRSLPTVMMVLLL